MLPGLATCGVLSGRDADALALIARMSTPPSDARALQIEALIVALKAAGVWTKIDALWVFAAATSQAALLNWKANATNATAESSPTFTADRGYAGDGAASWVNLNWQPSTHGVQYARNSAHFGLWSRTSGTFAIDVAGTNSNSVRLRTRDAADDFNYRINSTFNTSGGSVTDGTGLFIINRSGASATQAYRNGSTLSVDGTDASTALIAEDVKLCRAASSGYTAIQVAAAHVGTSLTSGEHSSLYTALNTYMVAVGAA